MTKSRLKSIFKKIDYIATNIDENLDGLDKEDIGHMIADIEFEQMDVELERCINYLYKLVDEVII